MKINSRTRQKKEPAEEDVEKGQNCNMFNFSSEVGFWLLNHHINNHCESFADKKSALIVGKTFAHEVMITDMENVLIKPSAVRVIFFVR